MQQHSRAKLDVLNSISNEFSSQMKNQNFSRARLILALSRA